jgi:hypothetical protein
MDQPELEDGDGPIGLILAPTRELATQIYTETKKFAKAYNLKVVCVHTCLCICVSPRSCALRPPVAVSIPSSPSDPLLFFPLTNPPHGLCAHAGGRRLCV